MALTRLTVLSESYPSFRITQEIRETLALGFPMAIALAAQTAMSFTDLILVGHLGEKIIAGVSLGLAIYTTVMLFALGIVTAVSPRVSQAFGAGHLPLLRHTAEQGIWLSLVASVPAVIFLLFTRKLLIFLGHDSEVAVIAGRYNLGAAWGLPAFICYINFRCVMSGVGQPKPTTWVMLSAVPLNALLGYAMIFGVFGINGTGVFGAGLSTSVVRIGILFAVTLTLMRGRSFRDLALLRRLPRVDFNAVASMFRSGLPIGVRIVLGEGLLPILALVISVMGQEQLIAHVIALRLAGFSSVIALAFSSAAATRVGWKLGTGDLRAARSAGWVATAIAILFTTLSSVILCAFPGQIAQAWFDIHDSITLHALVNLLPVVALYQIINTAQIVLIGSLLGMSDTKIPTYIVLFGTWIVGLCAAFLLGVRENLHVGGVWIGLTIGVLTILAIVATRFTAKTKIVLNA